MSHLLLATVAVWQEGKSYPYSAGLAGLAGLYGLMSLADTISPIGPAGTSGALDTDTDCP